MIILKFELKSKLRLMCEGGFFHLVFITDNSLSDYITIENYYQFMP